jgi:prevent-host-death family protein
MNWSIREARRNFSKLLKLAISKGPQIVTLRGVPTAVVLSAAEFDRLAVVKPSFVEHLLSLPELDSDIIDEINRRDKRPSRPANEF